jgi:hypothetical protein
MVSNALRTAAVVLLAAVFGPVAATAQQGAPRILVTGTVVDSITGFPVYGVAIATSTTADRTASDSTGAFTLSIPAGTTMVTFTGRGFQRTGQIVAATANVDLGRIPLLPDAVALEPIEASVSQLEERVRTFTGGVQVFGSEVLQHSGDVHLLDFVKHRVGARTIGCQALDPVSAGDCLRVRGIPARPRIFINEVQVANQEILTIYSPESVARVEVFGGGQMIRVYTRGYLEMMSRTSRRPEPLIPS